MTEEELFELLDEEHHATIKAWLERGDGCAVYQNRAMDSSFHGHRQYVSYGSPRCLIEEAEPPQRLPDFPGQSNWAYQLEATIKREP